jgi:hypothetical protein
MKWGGGGGGGGKFLIWEAFLNLGFGKLQAITLGEVKGLPKVA